MTGLLTIDLATVKWRQFFDQLPWSLLLAYCCETSDIFE